MASSFTAFVVLVLKKKPTTNMYYTWSLILCYFIQIGLGLGAYLCTEIFIEGEEVDPKFQRGDAKLFLVKGEQGREQENFLEEGIGQGGKKIWRGGIGQGEIYLYVCHRHFFMTKRCYSDLTRKLPFTGHWGVSFRKIGINIKNGSRPENYSKYSLTPAQNQILSYCIAFF